MTTTHKVKLAQLLHYQMTQHHLAQRVSAYDAAAHLPLHATEHTTPYLSLLARVEGFADATTDEGASASKKKGAKKSAKTKSADADVDASASIESAAWWTVLHSPAIPSFALRRCMRGTLHLIPRTLLSEIASVYSEHEEGKADKKEVTKEKGATKKNAKKRAAEEEEDEDEDSEEESEGAESAEEVEELRTSGFNILKFYKMSQEEAEAIGEEIISAIKQHGPQTSATIRKYISKDLIKKREAKWGAGFNIAPVMKYLYQTGRLEYGVPATERKKSTSWRNGVRLYGINTTKLQKVRKEKAMVEIAKWYFRLYGPAAFGDFVWWAGLGVRFCRAAFDTIKDDLTKVKVEGIEEEMYMYPDQASTLTQSPNEFPSMARLLPYEDALIKAYKPTRHRFFGTSPVNGIITTGGEARPTVWVDGRIVGVWTWKNKPGHDITVDLFDPKETDSTKAKSKAAKKSNIKPDENAKDKLKKKLDQEIAIVSKFLESKNVIWT